MRSLPLPSSAMRFTSPILAALSGSLALALASPPAKPETTAPTLARPFGSAMVLPMHTPVPLSGTATPAAKLTVRFGTTTLATQSTPQGTWEATLPPMEPSATGRNLEIASGSQSLVLTDVLVGQVWLCAGQSNMDFPLASATGGPAEAAAASRFHSIRLCNLTAAHVNPQAYDAATLARLNPKDHYQGSWSTAANAAPFSAVGWWTARLLHEKLHIPIGMVDASVGGSGTEAWIPLETLNQKTAYQKIIGPAWLDSSLIGTWARNRAKDNLGSHRDANHPFRPGFLFESGVKPWTRFPFAGVLWYQGETNAEVPDMTWNEQLILDLVHGWRTAFHNPSLPFFMIQLPRIGGSDPMRAHWPAYRDAQRRATSQLPHAHLIPTADLGWDSPDVHPPDKLPVAKRLAATILATPPPEPHPVPTK